MRVTKSEISLELECWPDDLSPAQLAAYERVANEHNAIKNALKNALSANEGKELFNGEVFQAYSFKGKVLQEIKEATLTKKPVPKEPEGAKVGKGPGRKRSNTTLVYLESSDEEDDVPLAKRVPGKKGAAPSAPSPSLTKGPAGKKGPNMGSTNAKSISPQTTKGAKGSVKNDKDKVTPTPVTTTPSELTSVGGLIIDTDSSKEPAEAKENNKEPKLQGKTFPSLVVLAKPSLKVKDMSATRTKLDSKVKLVLMLTPNKFTEWLIQEGLLKAEQTCSNHRNKDLKLGVFSDATKFPYSGGYVWLSECCKLRFVSVFHGSIFEGAPHPPSCILKLIYHWSCQTNIQNVVQWVKVDNVYIKGVYTWLRAVCTLAVHQKLKKIGGPERFVEVGVISLGTTSQDGQQRQVKVEVLGVLDHTDKTIRLRAVEPITDLDRNYKKRFQTILEPLQRWVHKDSWIVIDLTVDRSTLQAMGFKNIVQAAATDTTAKHNNSVVMDYLRRIVPRMFQNTLSLLSRQMIQQFLDELVWREQYGTYALQAFNNITSHIAEQTRINSPETLIQRLYQVATNPFKDWSVLPPNCKEIPPNTTPKRLKKPITEEDYSPQPVKLADKNTKSLKKDKDKVKDEKLETNEKNSDDTTTQAGPSHSLDKPPILLTSKRKAAAVAASSIAAATLEEDIKLEKKPKFSSASGKSSGQGGGAALAGYGGNGGKKNSSSSLDVKGGAKKEDDDLKGLEELYYGILNGKDEYLERLEPNDTRITCPICCHQNQLDNEKPMHFDSNDKFQTHLVSHISIEQKDFQFQCLFCLEKHESETVLAKHNLVMHPTETKPETSASYHCLICTQRYNSLHQLTVHLQKCHNILELPYCCKACGYRSSSHRDVVRHFYDEHKNHNFLQCPFCLDVYRFAAKGKLNEKNIENYYMHLRTHTTKKDIQLKCHKCSLSFTEKGCLKQHLCNHHLTLQKMSSSIKPLLSNSLLIALPKVKTHHRDPLPFTITKRFPSLKTILSNDATCAECNTDIISEPHYVGVMKCGSCKFVTCCERAMFQHSVDCLNATKDPMELPLPNEMHCLCGFSTAIGNKMANHLVRCGLKTAYTSVQAAQENTVKRNMLDMLGLVRRDGETGNENENEVTSTTSAITTTSSPATANINTEATAVNVDNASEVPQESQQQPQMPLTLPTASSSLIPDESIANRQVADYNPPETTMQATTTPADDFATNSSLPYGVLGTGHSVEAYNQPAPPTLPPLQPTDSVISYGSMTPAHPRQYEPPSAYSLGYGEPQPPPQPHLAAMSMLNDLNTNTEGGAPPVMTTMTTTAGQYLSNVNMPMFDHSSQPQYHQDYHPNP